MRDFARLYTALDETTATGEKITALAAYFRSAPPADAAWAVHFLSGRRPKRLVSSSKLAAWAAEAAAIPSWLFEESRAAVGDLAETITLLLPDTGGANDRTLTHWVEDRLLPLRGQDEAVQRAEMLRAWRELDPRERFVWNKLITGAFRVGASARLVVRAIALASGVPDGVVAHRLMGGWEPTPEFFLRLTSEDLRDADVSRPYPFHLAHPLDVPLQELGSPGEWMVEWKWDGIRCQLIRRAERTFLWSRSGELLSGRFPEVEEAGALLPEGTVLDGELLPWVGEAPLPFAQLQRRIGRKTLSRKILAEVPVVLAVFDLLEENGVDMRTVALAERRGRLAALLATVPSAGRLRLSAAVAASGWDAVARVRAGAKAAGAEGLMLKRRDSAYGVGRRKGGWWKWKVDPLTVDAVLMYAQPGSGRRAGLLTDYTFGVWDDGRLVPFAKAYSGLTDQEIRRVDAFIRRHTVDRHGPVRVVKPALVFELAFEGIQSSSRHKSGIAVRFPRMARWRQDKRAEEADSLESVRALLVESVPS